MNTQIAVQLYTVRDETAKDFVGTLEKVMEIGYKGVEFAGFDDVPASRMKSVLDRLGLKAAGSHTSISLLTGKLDEVMAYNLEIGNKYIICPHYKFGNREDYINMAKVFDEIGEKCRANGLQFGYHNHDFEFTSFDGVYGLDILYKQTKPENMVAEIDTCWAYFAGVDPVSYIRKYNGRCPLIHLKDLRTKSKEEAEFFAEVGTGINDIPGIVSISKEIGSEWVIVEQDACYRPSLESIKISYENVKKLMG